MSETKFNSANYITLRQFQGGWIWLKNINAISNRILPLIAELSLDQVRSIADLLNGNILTWQIYDDTQWVLRIIPLSDFIILIVFNNDEEFGPTLKIFYHKSSLIVPTEDSYVFTEIFLGLLGYLAKSGIIKAAFTKYQNEIISLPNLLEQVNPSNKEKIWNDIIGQREIPLLKIDQKTAKKISTKLKVEFFAGTWQNIGIEWGLKFNILKNLSLYTMLPLDKNKFKVFYTKNILNYESQQILFFTILYCNAIIREARVIMGDALPKLSKYL